MELLLTIVHVIVCVFLCVVILLQAGKAGAAAVFGGGGQTMFGPRGAQTFLGKATAGMATIFMLTSMGLAYLSSQPDTVLADEIKKAQVEAEEAETKAAAADAAGGRRAVQPRRG